MKQTDHRLAAIMYTDIKGFSKMMEDDEAHTLEALEYHNEMMNIEVKKNRGRIIKTIGDAIMADFPTAQDAVKTSASIQHALCIYNLEHKKTPLLVRIGVHLGDIYFFENDALGEGINIAARLQSIAQPGGICISGEVFNQVSGKLELKIEKRGSVQLKNISREIVAYNVKLPAPPGLEEDKEFADRCKESNESHDSDSYSNNSEEKNDNTKIEMSEVKDYLITQMLKVKESVINEIELNRNEAQGYRRSGMDSFVRERGSKRRHSPRHNRYYQEYEEERPRPVRNVSQTEIDSFSALSVYKKKLKTKLEKASNGFRSHAISFLSVNAGLFMINMLTSASYPWFLYPLGGWGIGLISNWAGVWSARKNLKDVEALTDLDEEELQSVIGFHRSRNSFDGHLISNLAVFGFLFMINVLTSPGFMWSLIPAAGMGVGVFCHWGSYSNKKRKFKKLKLFSRAGRKNSAVERPATNNPQLLKAYNLKDSIEEVVLSVRKNDKGFAEDLLPQIDQYIEKISFLSTKEQELQDILKGIPSSELEKDKLVLVKKKQTTDSKYLIKEYDKSIEEIDRQQVSISRLNEQQELLKLRVNSAVNNLQQINLNLMGMKTTSSPEDTRLMSDFEEKSGELSQYYKDLVDSYKELENEGL